MKVLECKAVPLRRLALNTSGAGIVIFIHVVVLMPVSFSVLQVTLLKVGVDVEVVVHALRLLRLHLQRKVAFELLQFVLWEEVGFRERHLEGKSVVIPIEVTSRLDDIVCRQLLAGANMAVLRKSE